MTVLLPIQDVFGAAQQILVLHKYTLWVLLCTVWAIRACNGNPKMLRHAVLNLLKKRKKTSHKIFIGREPLSIVRTHVASQKTGVSICIFWIVPCLLKKKKLYFMWYRVSTCQITAGYHKGEKIFKKKNCQFLHRVNAHSLEGYPTRIIPDSMNCRPWKLWVILALWTLHNTHTWTHTLLLIVGTTKLKQLEGNKNRK